MHYGRLRCIAKKKALSSGRILYLITYMVHMLNCYYVPKISCTSRIFAGLITPASRNLQMLSLSSHFSMTDVGHDPHSPVEKLQVLFTEAGFGTAILKC